MVGSWGYKISKTDNVSYGIYLYHFPIIQLGIWLGIKEIPSYIAVITVILVTSALSYAAWKLVGSRFVKSKKPINITL